MFSDDGIFHIRTGILFVIVVGAILLVGNDDSLAHEMMIDDRIPSSHLGEDVFVVHFCRVRQCETQLHESHLLFQLLNEANVLNVVFNELLKVLLVELGHTLILCVGVFLFSKFHKGDVIQTVGFLVHICKRAIQFKVINTGNPNEAIGDLLLVHAMNDSLSHLAPRRQPPSVVFTHDARDSIVEIWNVEELDVPSGEDRGRRFIPKLQELLEHVLFTFTDVGNYITFLGLEIFVDKYMKIPAKIDCDCVHRLGRVVCVGKSVLTGGLDVEICDVNELLIVVNFIGESLPNVLKHEVGDSIHFKVGNGSILIDEITTLGDLVEWDFLQEPAIKSSERSSVLGWSEETRSKLLLSLHLVSVFNPSV